MLFPDGIPQKDKFNFAWIGLAYKKVLKKILTNICEVGYITTIKLRLLAF